MAHYIESEGKKTYDLLVEVLRVTNSGQRAVFLCEASNGLAVTARMRVMLSKHRKKWDMAGKARRHYTLYQEIVGFTNREGKRRDMVTMWMGQRAFDVGREMLDDLMRKSA